MAERFPEAAVQKSIDLDLTLIDAYARLLTDLELDLVRTARAHAAQTFYRLRAIPGVGNSLALVLRDEIHDIQRVPRVPECVSYGRLVKCAQESAGPRYGTSGKKIGHASRTWAFSEAAVLFLRNNPAGQKYLARLANKHGKGKAFTVLAHTLARAVYDMLKRDTAFDMDKSLTEERRGVSKPAASRAADGISPVIECWCRCNGCVLERVYAHRPCSPDPCALMGRARRLLSS